MTSLLFDKPEEHKQSLKQTFKTARSVTIKLGNHGGATRLKDFAYALNQGWVSANDDGKGEITYSLTCKGKDQFPSAITAGDEESSCSSCPNRKAGTCHGIKMDFIT